MPYYPPITVLERPPKLVDENALVEWPKIVENVMWMGPCSYPDEYSTTRFLVARDSLWGSGTQAGLFFYKSTDRGITWTQNMTGYIDPIFGMDIIWDRGATWLIAHAVRDSDLINISSFSMATETWNMSFTSFTVSGGSPTSDLRDMRLAYLSNGNMVLLFRHDISSSNIRMKVAFYNGSTWTVTELGLNSTSSTSDRLVCAGALRDDNDNVHLLVSQKVSGTLKLHYAQISSTGTITVPIAEVRSSASTTAGSYRDSIFKPDTDEVMLLEDLWKSGGNGHTLNVVRAVTSSGAAPVTWNAELVQDSTGFPTSDVDATHSLFVRRQDGDYSTVLFFAIQFPSVVWMYMQDNGDSPVWTRYTYWDITALPPDVPEGYTLDSLDDASGTWLPDGYIGFVFGGLLTWPENSVCGIVLYSEGPLAELLRKRFPEYLKRMNAPGH